MYVIPDGFQPQCLPVDHAEQPFHQVRQVGHLGALVRENRPVHGGQLGQALQRVLGHVRILPDLPVHLEGPEGYSVVVRWGGG